MPSFLSIVYQITQECPLDCEICLRKYTFREKPINPEERRNMVDILKERNLGRLNVTGGEPTILGDELHKFLIYAHNKQVHTCLTTTGFRLNRETLMQMDEYVDQMMISFHSVEPSDWQAMYSHRRFATELYENVMNILEWCKDTSIIMEVNTVVHRKNIGQITDIGRKLQQINPNIIWRLDEYYGMGLKEHKRNDFELGRGEFESISSEITGKFDRLFRDIHFTSLDQRKTSPGFLITHKGELVTTFDFRHTSTGFHLLRGAQLPEFKMLRDWSEYRKVCRDWGWGDL
jgi:MoaA/NifB/PqqE/SkfB family radical SAM enzyme